MKSVSTRGIGLNTIGLTMEDDDDKLWLLRSLVLLALDAVKLFALSCSLPLEDVAATAATGGTSGEMVTTSNANEMTV